MQTSSFPLGADAVHPDVSPRPVSRAERISTLDIIRGVALLGILLMNIPGFGFPNPSWPALFSNPASTDFKTLAVINTVFEGTMRTLFSMLFGAGVILFTAKTERTEGRYGIADYYYRRLLWLILFGVINGYVLLWWGDILYAYGVAGLLLFPFRKLTAKWLLGLSLVCMMVMAGKGIMQSRESKEKRRDYLETVALEKQHKQLTDKQKKAKEAWLEVEKNTKTDPKKEAEVIKQMRGGYGTVFNKLMGRNSQMESTKFYQFILWDVLVMMFLGMALFNVGFFSNRLSARTYLLLMVGGYGVGLSLGWMMFSSQVIYLRNPGLYLDTHVISPGIFYDLRRGATAIGHASLVLLVYRSGAVPRLMRALASVGQMAFTNYIMHTVLCTLFFYGYGLGYYGKLAFHQLYYVVACIWLFQLIASPLWLHYFRFGPLEWAWRSLTYWQRQPMRRAKEEAALAPA